MTERLLELGGKVKGAQHWKTYLRQAMETVPNGHPPLRGVLYGNSAAGVATDFGMLYNGLEANAGLFDMVACMPDEWRDIPEDVTNLDYINWPRYVWLGT